MRFDSAVDVTASELRVELRFLADEDSEQYFTLLAAARRATAAELRPDVLDSALHSGLRG